MDSLFDPAARGDSAGSALPLAHLHPLSHAAHAPVSVSPVRPTSAPDHAAALHNILDRPVLGGNLIELLTDSAQTEAAIFAAVRAARDHVHLECPVLDPEASGAELADLVVARRATGVSVSLMLDASEAARLPQGFLARLHRGGVALCRFNAEENWQRSVRRAANLHDHRKLLIVDGRLAFIGGAGGSGADTPRRRSRDTYLRIEGPVVAHLQEAFVSHWVEERGRQPSQARHYPGLQSVGAQRAGVAVCAAGSHRSTYYRALLAAVERARGRVFITTAHFLPPRPLLEALCAACQRGVDVRVLLPGNGATWPALATARVQYTSLLKAGAHVFELPDTALHARTAVVDDEWAAVGSSSIDWSKAAPSASIDVIALDPVLAAQLESTFRDDQAVSRTITPEQWSQRSLMLRLQEFTARRLEFFP